MYYTYTLMEKFINNKYYEYEQTINMLDVYMGFGRITVEQYAELSMLADEKYGISHDDEFTKLPNGDVPTTLPSNEEKINLLK